MKVRERIFIIATLLLVVAAMQASAQPMCPLDTLKPRKVASLDAFNQLAILDEGRIKPVETYARKFLLQLSGRERYDKESAAEWFARFLFAPRTTLEDKVFLINNPEIAEALKLELDKHRRYSFKQLESGFDKLQELATTAQTIEFKSQSLVEKEIIRVYSNAQLYIRLSGAFLYGFPHPDFTIDLPQVRQLLELPDSINQFSFFDIVDKSDRLHQATQGLQNKEQSQWDEIDQIMIRLINGLFFWMENYTNCPLGIIPTKSQEDEQWLSPLDVIAMDFQDPDYSLEVKLVRDMTVHYWNAEQLQFDLSVRAFQDVIKKQWTPAEKKAVTKIPLELLYNKLNFFLWAKLFYGITFLLFLFSLLSQRRLFYPLACAGVILGFVPHLTALVMRIIIMSRPPVSSLYETFIFVGLIAVILGIILELVNKNWLGLLVSSVGGLVLLLVAGKFASEGDTMKMLVAVLNSNFWLSTHVLSITTGYAGCSVAGIVGHIYILQALTNPSDKKRLDITYKNLLGILGFGLTMTFLGTTLGGIWADQSWGRFWGWDPKENGALLIVLWCAIIFHARIAKLIGPLGVAIGCVLGLVVVMWAWFGVNLLSVGLHSYGFTSGIANVLALYMLAELIFITGSVVVLKRKKFNNVS